MKRKKLKARFEVCRILRGLSQTTHFNELLANQEVLSIYKNFVNGYNDVTIKGSGQFICHYMTNFATIITNMNNGCFHLQASGQLKLNLTSALSATKVDLYDPISFKSICKYLLSQYDAISNIIV